MSYRQEIHGQLSIPDVDELMEEAERNKQLQGPNPSRPLMEDVASRMKGEPMVVKAPLSLPKDIASGGFGPDVIIRTTEPMKIDHPCRFEGTTNRTTWEEAKMAPEQREYPHPEGWSRAKVGQYDPEAVHEDEALRRKIRDAMHLLPPAFYPMVEDLNELLGRYEALYAIAESLAKISLVNGNGYLISHRPQENVPGTDHL